MQPTRRTLPTNLCCGAVMLMAVGLLGCNQYSTPVVQSSTTTANGAATAGNGVTGRAVAPLNNQADPSETTGSVGGSPAGTASSQTAPSSSDGIR